MTEPLRAAIIGTGKIAGSLTEPSEAISSHAQALAADPRFVLETVVDADPDRAAAFAQRWSVPRTATLAELPGLDIVAVCTPDATHASVLRSLLDLPTPPRLVVMEKPLCLNALELDAVRAAMARAEGTAIAVNHSRRFDERYLAVQELVADGSLGRVVAVRWDYYGGWMHTGAHVVDTLRLVLDGELDLLRIAPGWQDRPGDSGLDLDARCDAHPGATIEIRSFPEQAFQLFEGEIRLEQGRIRFLDFGAEILVDEVRVNAATERELKATSPLPTRPGRTAMAELYHRAALFLLHGDTGIITRAGLEQAAATLAVLFTGRDGAPATPPRRWPPT